MTEQARLDSHKLIFHPKRLSAWLNGDDIYPIYVEIGPSSRCNYRCSFCALDYTGYKGDLIPRQALLAAIDDMAAGGVKSVMFAGAGESLLHPDIALFIEYASRAGLDVAVTTNGSLLDKTMAQTILPYLSWIRVSINAGDPKVYAAIHGCAEDMLATVCKNLTDAVAVKRERGLPVTIGTQCLILGENLDTIEPLTVDLKRTGVDYLSLKPFSKHPLSRNKRLQEPWPELNDAFRDRVLAHSNDHFRVSIRNSAMEAVCEETKPYGQCLGLPFFTCIEASGDIYPCHSYMGLPDFSYGNLNETSFHKIWQGVRRQRIVKALKSMIESKCRKACRLDQINRYLWQLQNAPEHVNFI